MTYYLYYSSIYTIMNTKMVVTNVRMGKDDWFQVKSIAGELGMSVNEYINYIIRKVTTIRELRGLKSIDKRDASIWELSSIGKPKGREKYLSKEDSTVYE